MLAWLAGEGLEGEAPTTDATARVGRLLGNVVSLAIFAMMAWVVLRGLWPRRLRLHLKQVGAVKGGSSGQLDRFSRGVCEALASSQTIRGLCRPYDRTATRNNLPRNGLRVIRLPICEAKMIRKPLTGAAQSPTDSVQRAMDYLKDKPLPFAGNKPKPGDAEWRPEGHVRRKI
jgi:hypothetical protein